MYIDVSCLNVIKLFLYINLLEYNNGRNYEEKGSAKRSNLIRIGFKSHVL